MLRLPLDADAVATVTAGINNATASPALAEFGKGFASGMFGDPFASFDEDKAVVVDEIAQQTGDALKEQVNTMRFYEDYLAVFPELSFTALPALKFSADLIGALRHPPLDLLWELYEHKPLTAYELDGMFFYSLSHSYTTAVVNMLPSVFEGRPCPHDLALFVQLAATCAAGKLEILVNET